MHSFIDRLETLAERLDFLDNLASLAADLGDPLHAAAYLTAELVHLHDPGRNGALHVANDVFDVEGGYRRLIGQAANLAGHDQKAPAVLAGLLRLDRGVDGQEVGLVGDLRDRGDDHVDIVRLLANDRQLR